LRVALHGESSDRQTGLLDTSLAQCYRLPQKGACTMTGDSRPGIKMRAVVFVSIVWLCVATAAAQQTLQKLTNVDIIKMTQEGFSEGVIVAVIEQGVPDFDVSVTGLTALKNAGISNKVMEAML